LQVFEWLTVTQGHEPTNFQFMTHIWAILLRPMETHLYIIRIYKWFALTKLE
jgi:hypothetical protein